MPDNIRAALFFLLVTSAIVTVAQKNIESLPKNDTVQGKLALIKMSSTSPGLSLGSISKNQCSWGIALLNHETDVAGRMERSDAITKASAQWPKPPVEALDSFVKEIYTSMEVHEVGFMQAMLEDDADKRDKKFNSLSIELSNDQHLLAYILAGGPGLAVVARPGNTNKRAALRRPFCFF